MVKKRRTTSEDKLQIVTFRDRDRSGEPSYKDLSKKEKIIKRLGLDGNAHPKRPRDDWPDPDKPRYANINRNDVRHDTRIEAETAERLEAFLEETGVTKTAATDRALNLLIDVYERQLNSKPKTTKRK